MFSHELQKRKNNQNMSLRWDTLPVSQDISKKSLESKCSPMSSKKNEKKDQNLSLGWNTFSVSIGISRQTMESKSFLMSSKNEKNDHNLGQR